MTRCKFRCNSIEPVAGTDPPASHVKMTAIHDAALPEDQAFVKYTPSGTFEAVISNPRALAHLKVGEFYHLDISACRPAPPAPAGA